MTAVSLWQPQAETAQRISGGLLAQLHSVDRKDVVAYHNAYTEYSLALMLYATGHRPVNDPLCFRSQLDEVAGFALFDDKASNESRRYRLSYLPDVAQQQMIYYLEHLSSLLAYLKNRRQPELRAALEQILSGSRSQKLPLFFYLRAGRVEGIGHVDISSMFRRYSPVPGNIHRKWIATTLTKQKAPSWLTACCLGHMETRVLPNGNFCHESHLEIRQHINNHLNPALLAAGWQSHSSQFRPQFGRDQGLPLSIHLGRELGQTSRFKAREAKRKKAKQVIRDLVVTLEKELGTQNFNSSVQAEGIVSRLLGQLQEQGLPVKYSLALFSRYSVQYLKNHPALNILLWSRPEQLEASPWKVSDISRYREARKLRETLFKYLECLARKSSSLERHQAEALRVITLALLSGQTNIDCLQAVMNGKYRLLEVNQVSLLQSNAKNPDAKHPILLLDSITAALSKGVADSDLPASPVSRTVFLKLAKDLGLPHQSLISSVSTLSTMAASLSQFESSGPARAIASGVMEHTPLDLKALTRIFYGQALVCQPKYATELTTGHELQLNTAVPKNPVKALANFTAKLRNDFKADSIDRYIAEQKNQQCFLNGKLSSKQEKAYLSRCLKFNLNAMRLPALGQLIAHWGIWLCHNRTRHKNQIQAKTVLDYLTLVAKKLHQSAADSVLYFDPDEWEQCYRQAIEGSAIGSMNSLAARLYDFHHYLVEYWRVPQIDWSDIFALAGSKNISAKVDANLVTHAEYQAALKFLLKNGDENREYSYCAWLLFIGFRFGLRWSEAYYLLQQDIIPDTSPELYVRVQRNSWRRLKTHCAQRLVPLIGELSSEEQCLVDLILAPSLSGCLSQDRERDLLCTDPLQQVQYEEFRINRILNSLLKQVSGDDRVHFHHLRHGYACRQQLLDGQSKMACSSFQQLINNLLSPLKPSNAYWHQSSMLQGVIGQRAISDLLGHNDMATTIHSYIHIVNWQVLNSAQAGIPIVSDRLLAMLLGRNEASVRKQRQRLGVPREALALKNWLANQLPSRSEPPLPLLDERSCYIDEVIEVTGEALSPLAIHSLLVNYSTQDRDIKKTASRLGLPQAVVRSVIDAAREVEKISGYERFAINCLIAAPIDGEFRNVAEWNSVDVALKNVGSVDSELLVAGLQAWRSAYHPSASEFFFDCYAELKDFMGLLSAIGVEFDRASYRLKGLVRDAEIAEQLSGLGIAESMVRSSYQRLSKARKGRKKSIELRVKKLSGVMSSKRQINRFVFVSSVLARLRMC